MRGCAPPRQRTAQNDRMVLHVALSYGGRWDIVQATRSLAAKAVAGEIAPHGIDEATFASALSLADAPDPDLFIRTGGEQRVSNFVLWNLAYTELYFCDTLWPDFGERRTGAGLRALRRTRAALRPDRRTRCRVASGLRDADRDRAGARCGRRGRARLAAGLGRCCP